MPTLLLQAHWIVTISNLVINPKCLLLTFGKEGSKRSHDMSKFTYSPLGFYCMAVLANLLPLSHWHLPTVLSAPFRMMEAVDSKGESYSHQNGMAAKPHHLDPADGALIPLYIPTLHGHSVPLLDGELLSPLPWNPCSLNERTKHTTPHCGGHTMAGSHGGSQGPIVCHSATLRPRPVEPRLACPGTD